MSSQSRLVCPIRNEDTKPGELTLGDVFNAFWRYRVSIVIGTLVFATLLGVVLALKYMSGAIAISSLEFKMNFDGAGKGKYPNGLDFSLNEIASPAILDAVYESNGLDDLISRDGFRNSIGIFRSDAGISQLESKYEGLLSNANLTPGERDRLTGEYETEMAKLKERAGFELVLRDDERRVPVDLHGKILSDILVVWARHAQEYKGIYLYQIPVIHEELLNIDIGAADDYFIEFDRLKSMLHRVQSYADKVAELPGALFQTGPSGFNITAVQVRLQDIEQFQLMPLLRFVRQTDNWKDQSRFVLYLEEMIYNHSLQEQEMIGTIDLLKTSLQSYDQVGGKDSDAPMTEGQALNNASAAQLSDGILDRLIAITTRSKDAEYRQSIIRQIINNGKELLRIQKELAYYKDLLMSGATERSVSSDEWGRISNSYLQTFNAILSETKLLTREVTEIYRAVSVANMRGELNLYTITRPVRHSSASVFTIDRAISTAAILFGLYLVMAVLFCVNRASHRNRFA